MNPRSASTCSNCTRSLLPTCWPSKPVTNLPSTGGRKIRTHVPFSDAPVTIGGVVDLPQADSFFQVPGAPATAQAMAPPDNVILVPEDQWHALFDAEASSRPDLVHEQIHAGLDRQLPSDPAAAFDRITSSARNLEARTAGAALSDLASPLDGPIPPN